MKTKKAIVGKVITEPPKRYQVVVEDICHLKHVLYTYDDLAEAVAQFNFIVEVSGEPDIIVKTPDFLSIEIQQVQSMAFQQLVKPEA